MANVECDLTSLHLKYKTGLKSQQLFSFSFISSLRLLSFSSLLALGDDLHYRLFNLVAVLGHSGVDNLTPVSRHKLDQSLLRQLIQSSLGKRSSNLQSLRDNAGCDQFVRRNLLVQLVVGVLIKQNQIVQFVPRFSLGPLLLLGLSTASPLFLFGVFGRGLGIGFGILFCSHLSCRSESSNISL